MIQIKLDDETSNFDRLATLRQRFLDGVKWWAEHQAWPATDEIRIERLRPACGQSRPVR